MANTEQILKMCDIPAVPMVAMKILRLVEEENINVDALQDVIMADQSLAARVLKMANSSFYGLRRNIDTVSEAIIMMGFNTIKNLALAVSTKDVYKKFGLLEQKLWEHSIGVSVAAGLLAQAIRFPSAEEATVAGLLHDVGKVVMNNSQPERFSLLTEMVYNDRVMFIDREKDMFGFGHAEVGGIFALRWGFSGHLSDAIRRHHFEAFDDLLELEPSTRNLCCIIALADAICIRLGVGYRGPMADLNLRDREYMELLEIGEKEFSDLIERFKQAYVEEKISYQM
ncbi:MAG: HDOD domain-containing protein [Nitrospiraceae bacterium]|nr:HDOD domain-containing protein [Nitrospiraceae bacterium]